MPRKLVLIVFALTTILFIQQLSFSDVPKVVDPKIQILIAQAIVAEDKNDLATAINTNKQILELQPGNLYATNSIAGLYGKLGHYQDELKWSKKALAINDHYELAYINCGNALLKLGKTAEAKQAYTKAAAVNPRSAVAQYDLGLVADSDDDFAAAIDCYKKAVAIDPKFIDAYFNLAADYANTKQFDAAIASLQTLLSIDPNAEDAKAMLAAIENNK